MQIHVVTRTDNGLVRGVSPEARELRLHAPTVDELICRAEEQAHLHRDSVLKRPPRTVMFDALTIMVASVTEGHTVHQLEI